ncbi:MAG TPA: HEPN domain-containing protein [Actinomycetota bacterium]
MRWEEGRTLVEELIEHDELERVTADRNSAKELLKAAGRHLSSAGAIRDTDPEGAYSMAYDAARKACAALLEAQGLRATSNGGHVAVKGAIMAQFSNLSGGAVVKSFDRLRRRRNDIEYPDGDSRIDPDEVDEAIARSGAIVDFADRLVNELPVF